jgi:hypothetical protein
MDAAIWWAKLSLGRGAAPIDTVAADMAAFGVKDFAAPDWMLEKPPAAEDFGVLPENWDAACVFLACSTQWLRDAHNAPLGLRYEGVEVVIRYSKVADPADVFTRIRVMEDAALHEFLAQVESS